METTPCMNLILPFLTAEIKEINKLGECTFMCPNSNCFTTWIICQNTTSELLQNMTEKAQQRRHPFLAQQAYLASSFNLSLWHPGQASLISKNTNLTTQSEVNLSEATGKSVIGSIFCTSFEGAHDYTLGSRDPVSAQQSNVSGNLK